MTGPWPYKPFTFRALQKTFGPMWVRCEADHFLKCPTCGHMIDMRDLAEVLEHAGPHQAPAKT